MADRTAIAWTDHTWNPWMGCQRVSQGCIHCYAETLTTKRMRLNVFGAKGLRQRTGKVVWARPRTWNRAAGYDRMPARVFTGSLMDVFEDAPGPNEWREDVWKIIRETPWLDYQLLTKRPENIARMLPDDWDNGRPYWPNVWLGTSIEDQRVAEREHILSLTPAHVHFVSYEPAIGPLELTLSRIEWVIFGGESGPGYRPMKLAWAERMRDACRDSINPKGTAYFFKQSAAPRTEMGIDALGEIVREYPESWDRKA